MANTVKLKRSAVPAKVPLTTDLELGELAINTYDGKLYLKKNNGSDSIVLINTAGGGGDLLSTNNLSDLANAATARTNLGLVIGTNVQAYDAGLQSIAGLTTAADRMIYTTASDTYAVTTLTSFARTLLDDTTNTAMRTTLGLGTAATRNTGTSGNTIPFLDGTNTWSANQSFSNATISGYLTLSNTSVATGSVLYATSGTLYWSNRRVKTYIDRPPITLDIDPVTGDDKFYELGQFSFTSLEGEMVVEALVQGGGLGVAGKWVIPLSYAMDYVVRYGLTAPTSNTWFTVTPAMQTPRHMLPNFDDFELQARVNGNTISFRFAVKDAVGNGTPPITGQLYVKFIHSNDFTNCTYTQLDGTGTGTSTSYTLPYIIGGLATGEVRYSGNILFRNKITTENVIELGHASDTTISRVSAGVAAIEGQTIWTTGNLPTVTAFAKTFLDDADAAAVRTTLGAAATSHTHAQSDITNLVSDLALKAPLASPALTGVPTAPTATPGTNTTQIATTAFVTAATAARDSLAELTDVTITAAASGDFLRHNGTAWVDAVISAGDVPSLDTSKITTGTFANARVASTNVTQHQAALSIGWSQLTSVPSTFTPNQSGNYSWMGTNDFFSTFQIVSESAGFTGAQLVLYHDSASPADGDTIAAVVAKGKDDLGTKLTYGALEFYVDDVTNTTKDSGWALWGYAANTSYSNILEARSSTGLTYNSNTVWHSGNDGAGSLLDADKLDGQEGSYYLAWANFTGVPSTFTPSAHVHAAADITSGVLATARLGTGTANSGTYLRGDGTWAAVAGGSDEALVADLASTHAYSTTTDGVNVFQAGLSSGYPADYTSVLTVRDQLNRQWQQMFYADNADPGKMYMRRGHVSNTDGLGTGWSAWYEFPSTAASATISGAWTFSGANVISGSGMNTTDVTSDLTFEGRKHRISINDGDGNFLLRIGHDYNDTTAAVWTSTETGYPGIIRYQQDTGTMYIGNYYTASVTAGATFTPNYNAALTISPSSFLYGVNTVWHSGNDGPGSGLNADLLDGYNIGTSGGAIPLLNGTNTWSGVQTHNAANETTNTHLITNTGSSRRLHLYAGKVGSQNGNLDLDAQDGNSVNLQTSGVTRLTLNASTISYNGNTVWHAGNDGASSGLDADKLDGMQPATLGTASTIAQRDGSGDIYARLIRQTYADQGTISGGMVFRINNSTDNYLRVCNSPSAIATYLGLGTASNVTFNRVSCGYDSGQANSVGCSNWFRSSGTTGWYSGTYGGGVYMIDTTWVRTYNSKSIYTAGELAAAGNVTAYYSDERFKTKVGTLDNALDKVCSLDGFLYIENDLAKSLGYNSNKTQVGLSAQKVQKVLPEAVSLAPVDMHTHETSGEITSKSGENYLTVDYSRLVPLLIEAIKELKAEINELKKAA